MGTPHHLRAEDDAWINQQICIRLANITGFQRDLRFIDQNPEYRSEYFNKTLLIKEIEHQQTKLRRLLAEVERRRIP